MIQNYPNNYIGNPYMQSPYNNYQAMQSAPQLMQINRPGLTGKVVNSLNEITASDVPMDGSVSYFPSMDGNTIVAKKWGSNGLIETSLYSLQNNEADNVTTKAEKSVLGLSDEVTEWFEKVSNRLDNIEKALVPKSTRKKVDSDD